MPGRWQSRPAVARARLVSRLRLAPLTESRWVRGQPLGRASRSVMQLLLVSLSLTGPVLLWVLASLLDPVSRSVPASLSVPGSRSGQE